LPGFYHHDNALSLKSSTAPCSAERAAITMRMYAVRPTEESMTESIETEVTAIYLTEGFLHKNEGNTGHMVEQRFASVEQAEAAAIPENFVFAKIRTHDGFHVFSRRWGWEFHKAHSGSPA